LSFLHISHNPIWDNGPTLLDYEIELHNLICVNGKKIGCLASL
jgi:hypothetical protein